MKKIFIIVVLLLGIASLPAQESPFLQKAYSSLIKLEDVDTTRIYQHSKACISVGLFTTGQKAGFDVDVNFGVQLDETSSYRGLSTYRLSEDLCKKIGLEVGYGNASFSYAHEVGAKSAWKKKAFAFNMVGRAWGMNLNFFRITNPFISGLSVWDEQEEIVLQDEFVADELALLRSFTVDGYYVFNNKRFAYPAAYKMGLIQRHTTGSWMLTARYMQGELYNSLAGTLDSYNLIDGFGTMQASIGGGYSVNFVPWHKDPVGPRDKGLRNITVNLTAMPVLTLVNRLRTSMYEWDEEGHPTDEKINRVWCYPVPNYIGSAAVSLTVGRVYFSAQYTYNRFYFRSRDAFDASQMDILENVDDLNFRGTFHDWMLKGMLVYRF